MLNNIEQIVVFVVLPSLTFPVEMYEYYELSPFLL